MEILAFAEKVEGFSQFLLVAPSTVAVVAGMTSMAILALGGLWAVRPR